MPVCQTPDEGVRSGAALQAGVLKGRGLRGNPGFREAERSTPLVRLGGMETMGGVMNQGSSSATHGTSQHAEPSVLDGRGKQTAVTSFFVLPEVSGEPCRRQPSARGAVFGSRGIPPAAAGGGGGRPARSVTFDNRRETASQTSTTRDKQSGKEKTVGTIHGDDETSTRGEFEQMVRRRRKAQPADEGSPAWREAIDARKTERLRWPTAGEAAR